MRLVDGDALIHTHESEVAAIGKDWMADDLAAAIETAPTIEAIPVEWIKKQRDLYLSVIDDGNLLHAAILNDLIKDWRKEQKV
jgi:hypothetical protein